MKDGDGSAEGRTEAVVKQPARAGHIIGFSEVSPHLPRVSGDDQRPGHLCIYRSEPVQEAVMLFYPEVGLRIDVDIDPAEGRANFYALVVDKRCADNDPEIFAGEHGSGESNALAWVEIIADDVVFLIVKKRNGLVGISGIVNRNRRSR